MEPSSDGEGQTGFQNMQHEGLLTTPQGPSERLNGDGRQMPNLRENHEGRQALHVINTSPIPEVSRESAPEAADQGVVHQSRSDRPGEDEFETFHRSFTIGTNPLDTLAARGGAAYGPFPDSSNGPDPTVAPPTPIPPTPVVRPPEQFQPSTPPQQPPPPSSPQPSPDKEDPTVVQARRSMMRRTGDRHARGKLPEPKEGRFLPPDCLPQEPQVPAPRSSKRYSKHKKRSPDVYEGSARNEDSKPLDDDQHVVSCRGCNLDVVVRKAAVVVRCKNCGKVNPASSVDRFDRSQFPPS